MEHILDQICNFAMCFDQNILQKLVYLCHKGYAGLHKGELHYFP